MKATPMMDAMRHWIGHSRALDAWCGVDKEVCRLTDDQAMRLCFECSFSGCIFETERALAFAAYQRGRPWDFLLTIGFYPRVVPMKRSDA